MTASALFAGRVLHVRHGPKIHRFRYRLLSVYLDLDEAAQINRRCRLFGIDRARPFAVRSRDHGCGEAGMDRLKMWAQQMFAQAGFGHCPRITLFSFPRVLGTQFNPISLFFGFDAAGLLRGVIYQVTNTFGDRHCYVSALDDRSGRQSHDSEKTLHVSPFNRVEGRYRFALIPPVDERFELALGYAVDDRPKFTARHRAARLPLTDGMLLRHGLTRPVAGFGILAAIHWEAGRLFLKGLAYCRRPAPVETAYTLVESRPSLRHSELAPASQMPRKKAAQ